MENNNFKETVSSLLEGMDQYFTTKTVVGEAINTDGGVVIPLVDVSFGMGAGAMAQDKKNSGGGGLGAKMTPSALLVINNGQTRLINVKNQDSVTKILDMVPDVLDRFKAGKNDEAVNEKAATEEESANEE